MIEGKSTATTAARLCGVHPTTAFRWRHRFLRAPAVNKPRSLSGIVEADETFILRSFKGRWSDPSRKGAKARLETAVLALYQDNIPILVARDRNNTFDAILPQVDGASGEPRPRRRHVTPGNHLGDAREGTARHAGLYQDNIPILVARDFERSHLRRDPASGRWRFGERLASAGVVTPGNHLIGDGGRRSIHARFRPQSRAPTSTPCQRQRKPTPEAPHLHINNVNAYHGCQP